MKAWQKIFLFCCTGLILFPSAVELAHTFSGHKHDYCNHYSDSHFHEKALDCELFHFQKQIFSFPPLYSGELVDNKAAEQPPKQEYLFISTYQRLHFSLRAPPAVIV